MHPPARGDPTVSHNLHRGSITLENSVELLSVHTGRFDASASICKVAEVGRAPLESCALHRGFASHLSVVRQVTFHGRRDAPTTTAPARGTVGGAATRELVDVFILR